MGRFAPRRDTLLVTTRQPVGEAMAGSASQSHQSSQSSKFRRTAKLVCCRELLRRILVPPVAIDYPRPCPPPPAPSRSPWRSPARRSSHGHASRSPARSRSTRSPSLSSRGTDFSSRSARWPQSRRGRGTARGPAPAAPSLASCSSAQSRFTSSQPPRCPSPRTTSTRTSPTAAWPRPASIPIAAAPPRWVTIPTRPRFSRRSISTPTVYGPVVTNLARAAASVGNIAASVALFRPRDARLHARGNRARLALRPTAPGGWRAALHPAGVEPPARVGDLGAGANDALVVLALVAFVVALDEDRTESRRPSSPVCGFQRSAMPRPSNSPEGRTAFQRQVVHDLVGRKIGELDDDFPGEGAELVGQVGIGFESHQLELVKRWGKLVMPGAGLIDSAMISSERI